MVVSRTYKPPKMPPTWLLRAEKLTIREKGGEVLILTLPFFKYNKLKLLTKIRKEYD